MLFLSFKNGKDEPRRNSFDKYHMPLVEIKDFIALINNKPFFDQSVKYKQKEFEKLKKMSKNNDYKTGNLFGYLYRQNYYKFFGKDLSKQKMTNFSQKINFIEKLEKDDDARMFFIAEKSHKSILNFLKKTHQL